MTCANIRIVNHARCEAPKIAGRLHICSEAGARINHWQVCTKNETSCCGAACYKWMFAQKESKNTLAGCDIWAETTGQLIWGAKLRAHTSWQVLCFIITDGVMVHFCFTSRLFATNLDRFESVIKVLIFYNNVKCLKKFFLFNL